MIGTFQALQYQKNFFKLHVKTFIRVSMRFKESCTQVKGHWCERVDLLDLAPSLLNDDQGENC
jgi:hypothetical protein